jgi:hypothetical protein
LASITPPNFPSKSAIFFIVIFAFALGAFSGYMFAQPKSLGRGTVDKAHQIDYAKKISECAEALAAATSRADGKHADLKQAVSDLDQMRASFGQMQYQQHQQWQWQRQIQQQQQQYWNWNHQQAQRAQALETWERQQWAAQQAREAQQLERLQQLRQGSADGAGGLPDWMDPGQLAQMRNVMPMIGMRGVVSPYPPAVPSAIVDGDDDHAVSSGEGLAQNRPADIAQPNIPKLVSSTDADRGEILASGGDDNLEEVDIRVGAETMSALGGEN